MFCIGANDQIIQLGKWMIERFQRWSQVIFPLIDPDLNYRYIISKVNTTNRELNLKNTFCKLCLLDWRFHVKAIFFLKNFNCDLFFDALIIGLFYTEVFLSQTYGEVIQRATFRIERILAQTEAPADLMVKQVSNTVINIGLMMLSLDSGPKLAVRQWIAWWVGLLGGNSSRGKLYVLRYHGCYIYGTWKRTKFSRIAFVIFMGRGRE